MERANCLFQLSALMAIILSGCSAANLTLGLPSPKGAQITEGQTATIIPHPTVTQPALGDTQKRQTDGMVMVYVPAGEFTMGSDDDEVDYALQQCQVYSANCQRTYFSIEMPSHQVVLDGFWLDQTEVTNNQYALCEGAGVCESPDCQSRGGDFPVVCVNWEQAASYCHWAGGRLPTEAEWEYAARGLNESRFPWGDEFEGTFLNYCDASCMLDKRDETFADGSVETAPVGSYPQGASWVGALDMAGNVWEMVADWYGEYLPGEQVNPSGPLTGSRRVARGGSWHASPDHVRSMLRTHMGTDQQFDHAGFRCARSTP